MLSLSLDELDSLVCEAQDCLKGSQFQKVQIFEKKIIFTFWKQELRTLLVDFSKSSPFFFSSRESLCFPVSSPSKPLTLFLQAHFKGLHLLSVERQKKWGRCVRFEFEQNLSFDVLLFSQNKNLIIHGRDGKKISYCKPIPLDEYKQNPLFQRERNRTVEELILDWRKEEETIQKRLKNKKKQLDNEKNKQTIVDGQIHQMRQELEKKQLNKEEETELEWIQEQQSQGKSPSIGQYTSLGEYQEILYEKIKIKHEKIRRLELRIKAFEEESIHSSSRSNQKDFLKTVKPSLVLKSEPSLRVRKFEVKEGITAYRGLSAKDNMLLLKKAKPWFLWFHLKDLPSSHCVVFFNKGDELKPKDQNDICLWFLKEIMTSKEVNLGGSYFLQRAEIRHVQPIKGDSLGRVKVLHYQTIKITLEK